MVNGRKIRRLREEREMTTAGLAQKVGASPTMISFIETGIKNPSVELLKRIADFFGCSVDDLIKKDEKSAV